LNPFARIDQDDRVTVNQLVVGSLNRPSDRWAGVWIAEDIKLLGQGVSSGSWIDAGLGGISAGLDALAVVSDPLGALLQYGVAWIIEHVKPLTEALDWLAGDPAAIGGQAQTWRNVAAQLRRDADDATRAAAWDLTEWTGAASNAYRAWAKQQQDGMHGLSDAANVMAALVEGAGAIIATVRAMVRDAIATCVSRLISYAAEEVFSLGLATPLVVEQVSSLVASWAAKITGWLRSLIESLRGLSRLGDRLVQLIDKLAAMMRRLHERPEERGAAQAETPAQPASPREPGPPESPGPPVARPELTDGDKAALWDYTTYEGYTAMNPYLREPDRFPDAVLAGTQQRADDVSAALAKLEPKPGTTYRGAFLSDDVLARYEPGQVVTERGFTSTSERATVADVFAGNTMITIEGTTGRDVAPFSAVRPEAEILYDKGTRFLVTGKAWDPVTQTWFINLTEASR
jgi:hypothetical protein